jgi:hypothetical protein
VVARRATILGSGRALARAAAALVVAFAAASGLPAVAAPAGAEPPTRASFSSAVSAWQGESAHGVAVLVPAEGRLSLSLLGSGSGAVTARATRDQAEAILKGYFDRIEGVSLRDATPPDARTYTRVYDYAYRPRGGAEKATRLSFTLQQAADGAGFVLVAVEERLRR